MQLLVGFFLALAISLAAFLARRLTAGGAVASVLVGSVVFWIGGWRAAAILIAFFVSTSLLETLARHVGRYPVGAYAKSGPRDQAQVMANGIAGVVFLLPLISSPDLTWPWIAFAGSIATATADTWATELGALSQSPPRRITNLRRTAAPGTSGAVSVYGTAAAMMGASFIGALTGLFGPGDPPSLIAAVAAAGFAGALLDSILGATLQVMYFCDAEGIETERHPLHSCGSATRLIRGWRWMDNDVVNLTSSLMGGAFAYAFGFALGIR